MAQCAEGRRIVGIGASEFAQVVAEFHSTRYLPWADWLHDNDPITLDICIKIAVHGTALKALARKHRMRRASALDRLQRGLERYWDRKLLDFYNDKRRARSEKRAKS